MKKIRVMTMVETYNYDNIIIDGKHPKSILYNGKQVKKLQYNRRDLIHKSNCYNFKYKISGTLGSIKFTNDGKLEFTAYGLQNETFLKLEQLSGSDNFSYNPENTMYKAFELTIHKYNSTILDSNNVIRFPDKTFKDTSSNVSSDMILSDTTNISNIIIMIPAITFEHMFTITTNEKQYYVTDIISTTEKTNITLNKGESVNLMDEKSFDVLKEYERYY